MTRAIHLVGFGLLLMAGVALQLAALVWNAAPTLADAVAAVVRRPALRWAILGFWLWLGWHLFARGDFG